MSSARHDESAAVSAELARELRDPGPLLDELTRARMERSFVQAWRMAGPGLASDAPVAQASARVAGLRFKRTSFVAAVALSACIGGLVAWRLAHGGGPQAGLAPGRFELRVDGAVVQSGPVDEAQLLESGPLGNIALELDGARLDMAVGTRLRLERLSAGELAFSLIEGRLDVDFHPRTRGEQRLRVETTSARVLVVGTRLSVEADANGATRVGVTHGAVDVFARASSRTRRVLAGEHVLVRADEGDVHERSVRAALERDLAFAGEQEQASSAPANAELGSPAVGQGPVQYGRLQEARKLLEQGRHRRARAQLREVSDLPSPIEMRVEALTLMAESYAAQRAFSKAATQYRRADALAPQQAAGDNARFALARLLDRQLRDRDAAIAAYRRYLALAPRGALAQQATQALCRLGAGSCP